MTSEFDPREVLTALTAQGRQRLGTRPVRIELSVSPEVPERLEGDADRLRQALALVLHRALAVTREGVVAVRARRVGGDVRTIRLRFEVTDRGASEPGAAFPHFGDASESTGDDDLALWRQLSRLVADELGVRRSPGEGHTFWFTVGFTLARAPVAHETSPAGRVLVVEDNAVNQKVAATLIQKLGFEVDVAADGQQALQRLESHDYDLVLMDCHMPVMDGYQATVEIRRREEGRRHTPIVALTAHSMDNNRKRCLDSGMDDFMSKPVSREALRNVLQSWAQATA